MKILLLEKFPEIKKEYLKYLEKNNEILCLEEKNNEIQDELVGKDKKKYPEVDVIIIRSKIIVNSELLDKYPNLKFVARVGVGLDKIDLEECKKRNIKVLNTPGANANAVADLVLAGILNLARNLNKGFLGLEKRFDYLGFELENKIVGIIGFGNIGKKIYNRLKAFQIKKFLIFDPFLKKEDVEKNEFCNFIENKNEIFKNSDIISFHIPLIPATKNFLSKKEINLLKKDVLIVNTSRGGIIDEKNLIKFLKQNNNAKFFADVWEEEPNFPKKELLKLKNSLITPHIGAMTKQAEQKMHYFPELENI